MFKGTRLLIIGMFVTIIALVAGVPIWAGDGSHSGYSAQNDQAVRSQRRAQCQGQLVRRKLLPMYEDLIAEGKALVLSFLENPKHADAFFGLLSDRLRYVLRNGIHQGAKKAVGQEPWAEPLYRLFVLKDFFASNNLGGPNKQALVDELFADFLANPSAIPLTRVKRKWLQYLKSSHWSLVMTVSLVDFVAKLGPLPVNQIMPWQRSLNGYMSRLRYYLEGLVLRRARNVFSNFFEFDIDFLVSGVLNRKTRDMILYDPRLENAPKTYLLPAIDHYFLKIKGELKKRKPTGFLLYLGFTESFEREKFSYGGAEFSHFDSSAYREFLESKVLNQEENYANREVAEGLKSKLNQLIQSRKVRLIEVLVFLMRAGVCIVDIDLKEMRLKAKVGKIDATKIDIDDFILSGRCDPPTLQEIGSAMGSSRQRAEQMSKKVMRLIGELVETAEND